MSISACVFQTDYYFEYTECDSTGSRWRVAIPHRQGRCSGLPEPVRGTDCSKKTTTYTLLMNMQCITSIKISNQVAFNSKNTLWKHFLGFIFITFIRFKCVRIHRKVFVLCHYANTVCAYLLYSFFLWSWGVFRDVIPAVHIMCGWLLFAGQRRAFWPVGCHSCGIQQFGHIHGLRRFRRRLNDLQQVSYILIYIYIHIFNSLSFYRSGSIC